MVATTTRVFFPYAVSFGAVIYILSYSFTWINSYLEEEEEEDDVNKYYLIYLFGNMIAAILCVYNILRYVWNVSKLQFPGPTPLPLLGNTLSLQDKGNFQESIRSLVETYGNVVDIIVLDGERIVLVNDPSFCKIVMKSMDRGDLKYFHLDNNNKKTNVSATTSSSWFRLPQILWNHRRYREKLVWQELRGYSNELDLFSRSDKYGDWKNHRRLLQPAFDQKHVRAMGYKIQQSVDTLVSNLPINNNKVVDIMPYLLDYGLDMIHSTTLAKQLSDLPDRGQFVVRFLTNASQLFNMYMFHPFPYFSSHILPYFGLNNREIQRRRELPAFRQYCRNLIETEQQQQQQHQQQRPAGNEASTTTSEEDENDGGQDNLLSLMVARLGDEFNVENAVDELIAFLFAGFDTTSTTLGNLVHDLTTNPSAQQKVHEELDDAFANNPSSSYDNIVQNHLPYLSACIRESQRLQPVAPMLFRRLHKDVRLQYNKDENGGGTQKKETIVAKGTKILVLIFLLHRDEKQYPDPETFWPERWLRRDDDDIKNPPPNSGGGNNGGGLLRLIPPTPGYYYAFGGGPKMCVGYQLGEKEVKMAAAGIFKSFEVTRCGERKIVDSFTTGPEKILCKFQPRKIATSR